MSAAVQIAPAEAILAVNNIEVIYDHVILVLKGVSLTVPRGGIVAILGANGAGKTTTLKAISNLLQAERGEVTKGSIEFDGDARRQAVAERARAPRLHPGAGGPPLLRPSHDRGEPAHRRLHAPRRQRRHPARPRDDLRLFPAPEAAPQVHGRLYLRRRAADVRHRPGDDVAPKMILLDEPSMGLAPQIVEEIFEIVRKLNATRGRVLPARRAEHQHGAAIRHLRLHPGDRPRRHGRPGEDAARERGREGVLSRRRRGTTEERSAK